MRGGHRATRGTVSKSFNNRTFDFGTVEHRKGGTMATVGILWAEAFPKPNSFALACEPLIIAKCKGGGNFAPLMGRLGHPNKPAKSKTRAKSKATPKSKTKAKQE